MLIRDSQHKKIYCAFKKMFSVVTRLNKIDFLLTCDTYTYIIYIHTYNMLLLFRFMREPIGMTDPLSATSAGRSSTARSRCRSISGASTASSTSSPGPATTTIAAAATTTIAQITTTTILASPHSASSAPRGSCTKRSMTALRRSGQPALDSTSRRRSTLS